MNRKILDVTMLCTLCICLMVAANIEEKNTIQESREEISSAYVISAADGTEVPVAGAVFYPDIHLRQNQMKRQESQRTPEQW